MKNTIFYYLSVLMLFTIGCSTSNKSAVWQNQEKNYKIALTNLKKGKSIKKNQKLLINAINTILKSQTIEKDRLISSESLKDKEKGYELCSYLYTKLAESKEYTNGQFDTQIISLSNEKIALKKDLKNLYYTKGKLNFEHAKKSQDKYLSRTAYKAFIKSKKYGNEAIDNIIKSAREYSIVHYYVSTNPTENKAYESAINKQFRTLENLELPFVKVDYNKKKAIKYDCEINIVFDKLIIETEVKRKRESFSKTIQSEAKVRGYVYQRERSRKLNWDIVMNINAPFNNCKSINSRFTQQLLSRAINYNLTGDERAIPSKYKDVIEKQLPSEEAMTKKAIIKVYEKIENRLKTNQLTTDGTKIMDGDIAKKTYWGIMDLYDNGVELDVICKEFPLKQPKYCNDFEHEIYVTSCGLAYWELGLITPDRIEYIKTVIRKEAGVNAWTTYAEEASEARKSALKAYLIKIEQRNKKVRKRRKNRAISNFIFSENSILTFRLSNGEYAVTACAKIEQNNENCHYWLVPIDYKSTVKPTIEAIKNAQILGKMIDCGWSKKQVLETQPEIEKIWNYTGETSNLCFGFAIHAIKHKDFINIKDKFDKIGTLPIIDEFKAVGTLGYENSYKRYDELYSNLAQQIKIFEYEKIPIKMVLEE